MRHITVVIFCVFCSLKSYSQADSVYFYSDQKLIPSIQIITPAGSIGVRENYSYFKQSYWLNSTDTVLLKDISVFSTNSNKKKNNVIYERFQSCDSIVNSIRNRATHHASQTEIRKIAAESIGNQNKKFAEFSKEKSSKLPDINFCCSSQYMEKIIELEARQKDKIQAIKNSKIQFYNYLVINESTIDSVKIANFIVSFDECQTDFKSIELIILNKPQFFMDLVNKMTETSFVDLSFKLNFLTHDIDDKALKKSIKKTENQTRRTKVLVKRIHSRKY